MKKSAKVYTKLKDLLMRNNEMQKLLMIIVLILIGLMFHQLQDNSELIKVTEMEAERCYIESVTDCE